MNMLTHTEATLPSHWYYDPEHYPRELDAIWYRDWVCVGRLDELPRRGDFLVASVGTPSLIATRDSEQQLNVFHNTCRHRGSALCSGLLRPVSIIGILMDRQPVEGLRPGTDCAAGRQ